MSKKSPRISDQIITAIIGLVGTIGAAYIGYKAVVKSTDMTATQTTETKQTIAVSTITTMFESGVFLTTPSTTITPLPMSSVTSTYTSTAIPQCPNFNVEHLELLLSTGEWKNYFPGQDGKYNLSLERGELGGLTNLTGRASLVNANDCDCNWEGSTQYDPLQSIMSFDDCRFSIDLLDSSGQITKINLKLSIGNSRPILFTISIP